MAGANMRVSSARYVLRLRIALIFFQSRHQTMIY